MKREEKRGERRAERLVAGKYRAFGRNEGEGIEKNIQKEEKNE